MVGDHVKLIHRTGGVVVKIDRAGNSGLGQIDVRFPDGAVMSGIFPDGGFEREGRSDRRLSHVSVSQAGHDLRHAAPR